MTRQRLFRTTVCGLAAALITPAAMALPLPEVPEMPMDSHLACKSARLSCQFNLQSLEANRPQPQLNLRAGAFRRVVKDRTGLSGLEFKQQNQRLGKIIGFQIGARF